MAGDQTGERTTSRQPEPRATPAPARGGVSGRGGGEAAATGGLHRRLDAPGKAVTGAPLAPPRRPRAGEEEREAPPPYPATMAARVSSAAR